jgi:branched-chain amino acid transport system permease protein
MPGRLVPLALLIAIVLAIYLAGGLGSEIVQRRITVAFIELVAVVGLYVFTGNSGIVSFGSVGFMAVGAYVSALLTLRPMLKSTFLPHLPLVIAHAELPHLAGLGVADLVAGALAFLIGLPLMRLSGVSASIATFALLIISYVVIGNWDAVTGGQQSLMGLPRYVDLTGATLWAVIAILVAFAYQETRWALALRASREDEVAARALGVKILRQRVIAFTLSAMLSGIAGALYGHFLGTLRVDNFYLDLAFLLIAMLVVGGMRSLTGAVLGTISISALSEIFRQIEVGIAVPGTGWTMSTPPGLGDVALALAMLLIILFRPNGITGGRELAWPAALRLRPRRGA